MKSLFVTASHKDLLYHLMLKNLKVRYKGSSLGFFWTLLNPLSLILIYYFFIKLMRFEMNLAELLLGIIPWHFFTMTLGDVTESISGNSTLIAKVKFPRWILPLSTVTANFVNYCMSFLVLILFLPLLNVSFSLNMLYVLPAILMTFFFTLGISLGICTLNVYFKDTPHILNIVTMAWFFLTPIIYPLGLIPERYFDLAFLNPMASLITLYRWSFLDYPFFPPSGWLSLVLMSGVAIYAAWIFKRCEPSFADVL